MIKDDINHRLSKVLYFRAITISQKDVYKSTSTWLRQLLVTLISLPNFLSSSYNFSEEIFHEFNWFEDCRGR